MQMMVSGSKKHAADRATELFRWSKVASFILTLPPNPHSNGLQGGWSAGPRPFAAQRSLTDNGLPLWVSCGQGNKSCEDLEWTNYRRV